jgi:hypothetical protein
MALVDHWVEQYRKTYDDQYLKKQEAANNQPEKKILPVTSLNRLRQIFHSLDSDDKGCTTIA